ncbi:MAG: hypothetical protein KDE68_06040 [Rhodocyclaceae bacterium]|nr:hypothetical protein [Rhodocyclaceae bacterium]
MNPIADFYRSDLRTGLKIVFTCLAAGILSAAPLWLFSLFGPADDTPTNLALIAMFGTIFAGLGAAIGAVWLVVELIFIRKR